VCYTKHRYNIISTIDTVTAVASLRFYIRIRTYQLSIIINVMICFLRKLFRIDNYTFIGFASSNVYFKNNLLDVALTKTTPFFSASTRYKWHPNRTFHPRACVHPDRGWKKYASSTIIGLIGWP